MYHTSNERHAMVTWNHYVRTYVSVHKVHRIILRAAIFRSAKLYFSSSFLTARRVAASFIPILVFETNIFQFIVNLFHFSLCLHQNIRNCVCVRAGHAVHAVIRIVGDGGAPGGGDAVFVVAAVIIFVPLRSVCS